ncbi:NAD(P)H-dependent oxidoreductase [Streptomyces sporangiiformans]|uniref:Oxidoreductase n=1 Tax=Streptomyces sporangiiformans TaxID=2315329 RepID=A0A505D8J8_9ACTN|nr:SAF domain-containing protein [Streptomyces sporangiiformans]TPQ19207.1 oxidoreductase [Streptomyces sporangiiformans]
MAYLPQIIERQRQLGRPIRVGLVGAGQMGIGLVAQTNRIPGMEVAAIADIAPGRADAAFRRTGRENVVSTPDVDKLNAALVEGRPVALEDAGLLVRLDLDIIVEASGVPEVGAAVALNGLLSGKDIALLNVETDVTVGLLLSALARRMGRVYTVCRGDEPVECKRLVDYALDLGLTVTCAGKGKNNPLDPTATPDGLAAQAAAKHMNPKMLTSFVDGSKTMIEMAALANATGLGVSRRGFHGPRTTVPELAEVFRPKADGGILDAAGVVDYCTGPVAPGVFVVAKCDDPVVVAEMDYLSMGSGPYYTFYRPYHLASVEAPLTIAEAVLTRRPSLAPTTWTAEVVACAKRDLRAGELLDGIGGSSVYGVTDHAATAAAEGMVPLGLAAGARVLRDIPAGSSLTTRDVDIKQDTVIAALRRLQDLLLAGNTLDALLPLPLPTTTPDTAPAPQSAFAAPLGT